MIYVCYIHTHTHTHAGMGERERRGLNAVHEMSSGSFRIERTERRTAYENMMDALQAEGSSFEVDLPIKRDMVSIQPIYLYMYMCVYIYIHTYIHK